MTTITSETGKSKLCQTPGTREVFTFVRKTDARTAMARGIAEYCSQLSTEITGRRIKFKRSLEQWSEPEVEAQLPSMAVIDPEPGLYEENSFAPTVAGPRPDATVPGPNPTNYLMAISELSVDFTVDVMCSSPEERMALASMLEDAFSPVTWMYGFRLALPHYHGAHANFTPISIHYPDNEVDAQQRTRRLLVKLNGRVPVLRVLSGIKQAQVIGGRLAGISVVVEIVDAEVPTGTSADEEASDRC